VGVPLTHHYLHRESAPLWSPAAHAWRRAPVSMLCGHACSLCAPPIASSVACPGLSPLPHVSHLGRVRASAAMAIQMVRVVQTQPTPLLLKLVGREALERSLRRNGHEDGKGHSSMRQMERCCARLGDLVLSDIVCIDAMTTHHHIQSTFRGAQT
jgi:hypothetical protein